MFDSKDITVKVPKKIIEGLKQDFKLSVNVSNATVLRKAIAVSSFVATNGAFDFTESQTIVKTGEAVLNLDNIT